VWCGAKGVDHKLKPICKLYNLYSPETVVNNEKKEENTQKQTIYKISRSDITHSGVK